MAENRNGSTLLEIGEAIAIIIAMILIIRWMVTTKEGFITGLVFCGLLILGSLLPSDASQSDRNRREYQGQGQDNMTSNVIGNHIGQNRDIRFAPLNSDAYRLHSNDIPPGATGGCITSGGLTECSYRR